MDHRPRRDVAPKFKTGNKRTRWSTAFPAVSIVRAHVLIYILSNGFLPPQCLGIRGLNDGLGSATWLSEIYFNRIHGVVSIMIASLRYIYRYVQVHTSCIVPIVFLHSAPGPFVLGFSTILINQRMRSKPKQFHVKMANIILHDFFRTKLILSVSLFVITVVLCMNSTALVFSLYV